MAASFPCRKWSSKTGSERSGWYAACALHATSKRARGCGRPRPGNRPIDRQPEAERGAFSDFAFSRNPSVVMRFDDSPADRESKSRRLLPGGSADAGLGEREKELLPFFFGYALPLVNDRHANCVALSPRLQHDTCALTNMSGMSCFRASAITTPLLADMTAPKRSDFVTSSVRIDRQVSSGLKLRD